MLDGDTVCGVKTNMNVEFRAKSVVLTNGTFLNGLMHIGRTQLRGGRISGTGSNRTHGTAGFSGHQIGTDEDRNTCTYRRSQRTLR